MKKTLITKEEAREKYGVLTNSHVATNLRYYLTEDGRVIDSAGDTRYIPGVEREI